MREALWAELLKVRRSRLPALTAAAFTLATGVCGLFMFILADPGRARTLGMLGDKAQLTGASADWPGYLALLAQAVAVGGLLIYGMTAVWLFGREFSDRTAKDLLALPTSRTAVVAAKFTALAGWSLLLALQVIALGLLIGALLGLPGASVPVLAAGAGRILLVAALTCALTTPFALAASAGRGYLAAVGTLFAALFAAQVIAALGYGASFPWSVPGLLASIAGPGQDAPGPVGYLLVAVVGGAGTLATAIWWQRADHTR
ncbi:ABC transporter permease [Planomonospora parontospora subsp. parontospora]|uniref:ABC transporter permease n=2 Tax=Planomonospora parontospora TaxID=58119 RepID=A0AA37BMM1_9ACTN|nr:ABC transporter permease [Planomonospora parontospora]GGK92182.1 ABC transporter permease [Planomonospora parontospora]GII12156.1 ABC transporter permease [Planomonospora parontospora subsp. parontospora]